MTVNHDVISQVFLNEISIKACQLSGIRCSLTACIKKTVHFLGILFLKDPQFKSRERIYTIDFSLFPKIKSLDISV